MNKFFTNSRFGLLEVGHVLTLYELRRVRETHVPKDILWMLRAFQIWMESSNFSPRARLSVEAVCKTWYRILLQIVGGFLLKALETPIHHMSHPGLQSQIVCI